MTRERLAKVRTRMRGAGGESDGFAKRGTKRGASDSNLTDTERFDLDRFEKRLRLLSLSAFDYFCIACLSH